MVWGFAKTPSKVEKRIILPSSEVSSKMPEIKTQSSVPVSGKRLTMPFLQSGMCPSCIHDSTSDDSENGVSIATTDGTTIPENIELKVEVRASVSAKEIEKDYAKIKEVLEKNEEISKVYDVKLIRTVDGVETEIQPSDIKEGATIKVTMARPAEITTDDFRLLHIHNADDVEFVSDYSLENNELSFNINRLSEFAFVTKVAAKAVMPGWAIALIIVLATCCLAYFLLFFVFNKWIRDEKDEDKAHRVLPFALGEKDGKKRLFSFPCKIFYREKEEIYKSKKDALDK